jgi:hypothetical protein
MVKHLVLGPEDEKLVLKSLEFYHTKVSMDIEYYAMSDEYSVYRTEAHDVKDKLKLLINQLRSGDGRYTGI